MEAIVYVIFMETPSRLNLIYHGWNYMYIFIV